jgi:hypothetical protein
LAAANLKEIHTTAAKLGLLQVAPPNPPPPATAIRVLTTDELIAFEQAYYNLAQATSPVTAETLRNTQIAPWAGAEGDFSWPGLVDLILGHSPAQRFSRRLWGIGIFIVVFIVIAEWQINRLGMKTNAADVKSRRDLWQFLLPWSYGGLGACAYLLRSAHSRIYQRSFDLRYAPEYLNRIGLGMVSGGAMILFTNYLASESDTVTRIGSAALGFLAGYSTDLLFNTVERVIAAIFPKVEVETVPKEPPPPPKAPGPPADPNAGGGDQGLDADGKKKKTP